MDVLAQTIAKQYAIYNGDTKTGGVYNVLASFMRGILMYSSSELTSVFSSFLDKNFHLDFFVQADERKKIKKI